MEGLIRTVRGDIDPNSFGPAYVHEHLITEPRAGQGSDFRLDDRLRMAAELADFREAGGRGLLDATTPEFGRDPEGLRRLSESTGVHVVAVTGHQHEDFWRDVVDLEGTDQAGLEQRFVRDLTEGMDGTATRAGAIKVGTSLDRITSAEAKVIRAAGSAHRIIGAPVVTHTTAGTMALSQLEALERAGVDPARICVGHLDRRLIWEEHLELARRGAFLGYDQISKDKYASDEERARFVIRLIEAGFGEQICLGGDMARRSYHPSFGGGPGLTHILTSFSALLEHEGLSKEGWRSLLIDNPARLLAWRPA